MTISFHEYLKRQISEDISWASGIGNLSDEKRRLRRGQLAFNTLSELRPKLAREIAGGNFDPFHVPDNEAREIIGVMLDWVEENWDNPEFAEDSPRVCILTGEDGENADDCTTHEHEDEA